MGTKPTRLSGSYNTTGVRLPLEAGPRLLPPPRLDPCTNTRTNIRTNIRTNTRTSPSTSASSRYQVVQVIQVRLCLSFCFRLRQVLQGIQVRPGPGPGPRS